jgi:hypothetical protein
MNENLIVEAVATINVPPSSLGPRSSLSPAPFCDKVCKSLLWRGFLLPSGVVTSSTEVGGSSLPSPHSVGEKMLGVGAPSRLLVSPMFGCPPLLSSSSEVGGPSRGGDFEGIGDFCFQTQGVSHEGNAKGFWDLMSKIDEEQLQEFLVSTPKFKGSREVKNLECSINYDVRSFGSSQGKAREPLL